jgi:ABC-type transport system substrate-binding protein
MGGVLRVIIETGISNLGFPGGSYRPIDLLAAPPAIENLIRSDDQGNAAPWLASSWNISADKKNITFILRKGVKFHDGTDFNAQAVKFIFDKVKNSPNPFLKPVKSIEVVDDYSLRLVFEKGLDWTVMAYLDAGIAGWIMSPTAVQSNDEQWLREHPVGTGPFKLTKFERDQLVRYDRFDGYWQNGKPYLDAVELRMIADPTTAVLAFQRGDADVTTQIPAKDFVELKAAGKFKFGEAPASNYAIAGDSANPDSPFSKIEVRRAVAHAIDNDAIAKAIGKGVSYGVNQLFPQRHWAFNPEVKGYPYDPKKAKELLTAAGYPNGFKTQILYYMPAQDDYFTAMATQLREVGIQAEVSRQVNPKYQEYNTKGWKNALMMTMIPISIGTDPAYGVMDRFVTGRSQFVSVATVPEFDTLFSAAATETDFEKRKTMLRAAVKPAIDDYALAIPFYGSPLLSVRSNKVNGDRIREIWTMQWTPEDAWMSK